MLTTTIDGLWVLQVLSGIEVLAPELGLRPYLPSVETAQLALEHPVTEELRSTGAVDESGRVDDALQEWLTVLSRRDVALLLHLRTPSANCGPERVVLARFAQWWVALERYAGIIRLSTAGTATSEQSAAALIGFQIERLCGAMVPASLKPATIDLEQMLATVHDGDGLRQFLTSRNLDGDQIATLALAADTARSAQASFVAIQSGAAGPAPRAFIEPSVVTVIDTPVGRLVTEHVNRAGRSWMIVGPGSAGTIASAVQTMMRRLPAQEDWHSHRKAV